MRTSYVGEVHVNSVMYQPVAKNEETRVFSWLAMKPKDWLEKREEWMDEFICSVRIEKLMIQ